MPEIIYRFLHPWFLVALPVPILLLALQLWRERRAVPSVLYSDLSIARGLPKSMRQRLMSLLPWTRALALCLGIVGLARPQQGTVEMNVSSLGVDIAMVLDVSGSMQDTDFRPNRLEAAKIAASKFVENRKTDRVSVVVFATSAALLCPPTLDMGTAALFIESIYDGIIANNSTAVGEGLGLAVKQLTPAKDDPMQVKSRVAILLTDGASNSGKLEPMQSAEIAKALGVRVYTIGMGGAPQTRGNLFGGNVGGGFDEKSLREIAEFTGGRYFHATDEKSLQQVYREIDEMEKSDIKVDQTADFDERFLYFWGPGLLLLALEFLLRAFWLRRLP